MIKRYDQCYSVNISFQELVDNLKEPFASSLATSLNLDKLNVRDFQLSLNSGDLQFYRMILGENDEK